MEHFSLAQAAQAMGACCSADGEISAVVIDNRTVIPGALFFAIKGDRFDGHDFVAGAIEHGACAAVCSRIPDGCDKNKILLVPDTGKAFLELAAWYRQRFEIPVVGITGSVGKTTTKEMTACVLSTKYKTLYTEGNLNNQIGVPRMCFRLDRGYEAAVLEMGMSAFGEISSLTKTVRPTIGLITNIGVSHIENLGSREGILKAKLEILDGMSEDAPLLLNYDDNMLNGAIKNPGKRKIYYYSSQSSHADFYTEAVQVCGENSIFDMVVKSTGQRVQVNLPAVGMHNVLDACVSMATGYLLGVDIADGAKALGSYCPAGMRQKIVHLGDLTVIEDCYNASPDSVRAALSVLHDIETKGHRIAVLGDMLELGNHAKEAHLNCGAMTAKSGVDRLFAYGNNARYYAAGASKAGVEATFFEDKEALFSALSEYINANDTILFKASRGMKLEEVIQALYKERESV